MAIYSSLHTAALALRAQAVLGPGRLKFLSAPDPPDKDTAHQDFDYDQSIVRN